MFFTDGEDTLNEFIRCGEVFAEIDFKNRVIVVKIDVQIVLVKGEKVVQFLFAVNRRDHRTVAETVQLFSLPIMTDPALRLV